MRSWMRLGTPPHTSPHLPTSPHTSPHLTTPPQCRPCCTMRSWMRSGSHYSLVSRISSMRPRRLPSLIRRILPPPHFPPRPSPSPPAMQKPLGNKQIASLTLYPLPSHGRCLHYFAVSTHIGDTYPHFLVQICHTFPATKAHQITSLRESDSSFKLRVQTPHQKLYICRINRQPTLGLADPIAKG
jgi:hypothetical protein